MWALIREYDIENLFLRVGLTLVGKFIIIIIIIIKIIIIIIKIIFIFKEDNIFSIINSLPYGPPMNTDIDYYQTFLFGLLFFVSVAILVVQYL